MMNERIRQCREDTLRPAAMFVDVDTAEVGSDLLNEPEIGGEHVSIMCGSTDGESRRHSQLQGHVEARIASGAELDA
ncbi:MAG: hypothetical protein DMF77_01820 [Acidobacteria bacterium]|nr:MAG: hypothetical protein DMF77_01820 [Acidobacteriota bacterium]